MGLSELNERMAEGLVGRAEHVGDAKGASWSTVLMVFWEFGKMLAGASDEDQLTVYRLEFLQPDGRWTGPYCAEWMTPKAFRIRDAMSARHNGSARHPDPDPAIFAANPGPLRHVCASPSRTTLIGWFGLYLPRFMWQGARVATYRVPRQSIAASDGRQVIYCQKDSTLAGSFIVRSRTNLVKRVFADKSR